ncbi:MAG: hypothetical protein RLY31_1291 [Bacteroidota bacterium]|jgi:hypothetical protein
MKQMIWTALCLVAWQGAEVYGQCAIALDTLDDFDTTRIVAAAPVNLGFLVPTGNVEDELAGRQEVEEAKAIFSFANEKRIQSFFLTLGVVERRFYLSEPDYSVLLLFEDGNVMRLFHVPDQPVFDRELLLWKYVHTCVVPQEIFRMLKHTAVEKIRILYKDYKRTVVLEKHQQEALREAVRCVEEQVLAGMTVRP